MRVEHAGLGVLHVARLVHEPPDDPGADERDRHRQEDQRLGDVLAAGPVGQHGGGETDGGRQAGDDDDPPDVVEQRPAQHGQHGAGGEEQAGDDRQDRRGTDLEDPLGRAAADDPDRSTPMTTTATPTHHSRLVKMFGQLSMSKKLASWNIAW